MERSILEAAVVGYTVELKRIEQRIAEVRQQLNGRTTKAAKPHPIRSEAKAKRRMSAAARKRIAAAQRKRWKEFHARQKAA